MSKDIHSKILIKRYAKAFSNVVKNQVDLDIRKELNILKKLFLSKFSENLINQLKLTSKKAQTKLIVSILEKSQFNIIIKKFCILLANAGRLVILPEIIEEFLSNLDLVDNIVKAEITCAKEPSEHESKDIHKILKDIYSKEVVINYKIDEEILGGFIIIVGSKMLDDSLRTRLDKFTKLLDL